MDTTIEALVIKLKGRKEELESELADVQRKLMAIEEVTTMLAESGISLRQTSLFKEAPVTVTTDKYADVSMTAAIKDILIIHPHSTARQIHSWLIGNGYKSTSKTLLRDTYGRLKMLTDKGEIIRHKKGKNLAQYDLKQKERGSTV